MVFIQPFKKALRNPCRLAQEFRMWVSIMTGEALRLKKKRTAAASELLESAAPVLAVHTSCVNVRQRVFEVSKNRRRKANA